MSGGNSSAWWRQLEWPPWDLMLVPVTARSTSIVRRSITDEIARWLGIGTADDMRGATPIWAAEAPKLAEAAQAYRYMIYRFDRFAGVIELRPDPIRGHLGYWLRKSGRGQGSITMANHVLLLVAFSGMKLKAVDWVADSQNRASIAVFSRLGARCVSTVPVRDSELRTSEVRFRLRARDHELAVPDAPRTLRELLT